MARLLFIVDDTFAVRNRGIVLVPGIALEDKAGTGTKVLLKLPDGSQSTCSILGAEQFMDARVTTRAILVDLEKSQVPIGTEVWTID
jgi:hypothetical protein